MSAIVGCPGAAIMLHIVEGCNLRSQAFVVLQGMVRLAESYPIIDVRGRGLMVAIEFGGPGRETEGAAYGTAAKVVAAARDRGLLILTAGDALPLPRHPTLNCEECGQLQTSSDSVVPTQTTEGYPTSMPQPPRRS